ncbi:MAG: Rid family detoxifying hydrolase, partial [Candidatus Omnitrophica bacterium]|nr:Rid family detoxifying hydrolase [Candidatus Omnitrophota bacterium]
TSLAPQAIGPYYQAIEIEGMLYVSGQIPLHPETGQMVEGGIVEQTKQVLRNLAQILTVGGSNLNYVVKTTIYMTDLSQFEEVNQLYAKAFGAHKPARSTVQVAALPKGALIEIDAVAAILEGRRIDS